ncbi:hypothetical protein ABT282_29230 [Streptomyces sp. NPDC000927]|uniref:helix-turn-helix domain-containing protein n=1 Tax=Streptomyces sp. NPDC000927 TaxID=3154371 RepID=UPI00331E5A6A
MSARTVDRTRTRYAEGGVAGLVERKRGGGKEQVPPQTRGRVPRRLPAAPPLRLRQQPEQGRCHRSLPLASLLPPPHPCARPFNRTESNLSDLP